MAGYNNSITDINSNVGIGTTDPGNKLHVSGGEIQVVNGSSGKLLLQNSTNYVYGDQNGVGIFNANNNLRLYTVGSERIRITSAGNVGIGVIPKTGGPTWQHIQFGGTGNIIARKSDSTVGSMFSSNYYINSSNVDSHITTGAATRMYLDGGDIRFDTAPSAATDAAAVFSNRLFIANGGNVGVGTTSPTTTLDIRKSLGTGYIGITNSTLRLVDTSTGLNARQGGAISLSGVYNSSGSILGGSPYIRAAKANANDGDYGFGLEFGVRLNGSATPTTEMVIDQSGNVGIGTTTPTSKLQINDGSANITKAMQSGGVDHDFLQLSYAGSWANNVGGLASINFTDNLSSSNTVGRIGVTYTGSQGKFVVTDLYSGGYGASGDVFTIQADGETYIKGNVGIGTTAPAVKLDVRGDILIGSTGYNGGVFAFNGADNIDSNWGLQIQRTTSVDDYNVRLKYYPLTGTARKAGIYNSRTGSYSLYSDANNNPNIIIPDGNVGIGTTSPTNPLTIDFASNGIGNITTSNNSTAWNTSSALFLKGASGSNGLGFGISATANDRKSWIQSGHPDQQYANFLGSLAINPLGGNVGIGTDSPGAKLQVAGNAIVQDWAYIGDGVQHWGDGGTGMNFPANDTIDLATTSSSRIRITPAGNVGIGTTSPKSTLDVKGGYCVDTKSVTITESPTTVLTVRMSNHTGCYVKLTAFGDWSGHSSIAYLGEFFLQNGADGYAEPGAIIRQEDNTHTDAIQAEIVDPGGTGERDFTITLRATATASFTAQLTYNIQGQFISVS